MAEQGGWIVTIVALVFWAGVLALRGGFWRAGPFLADSPPDHPDWSAVVCVIPARNEAATFGRTLVSLFLQVYSG